MHQWILIIFILLLTYFFFGRENREAFWVYGQEKVFKSCQSYKPGGVLYKVLKKYGIRAQECSPNDKQCQQKWNLYIPCGYTRVEKELPSVEVTDKKQLIFGIKGCDSIVSKSRIWQLLVNKYGRIGAKKYMPETYVFSDKDDLKLFQRDFSASKIYMLKANKQRQTGLKISNNYGEIMKSGGEYCLVQDLLKDPYLVKSRKINLRVYMLVMCHRNKMIVYIYNNGFVYYTPKFFRENSLERDENITTGYIPRKVYKKNPLTLNNLRDYLKEKGIPDEKLFSNIEELVRKIMDAVKVPLCKSSNVFNNKTFQLFGVDMAPDRNLDVKLMEINKGPDMISKDKRDGDLKFNVQEDILDLVGIIKTNRENGFKQIWTDK